MTQPQSQSSPFGLVPGTHMNQLRLEHNVCNGQSMTNTEVQKTKQCSSSEQRASASPSRPFRLLFHAHMGIEVPRRTMDCPHGTHSWTASRDSKKAGYMLHRQNLPSCDIQLQCDPLPHRGTQCSHRCSELKRGV